MLCSGRPWPPILADRSGRSIAVDRRGLAAYGWHAPCGCRQAAGPGRTAALRAMPRSQWLWGARPGGGRAAYVLLPLCCAAVQAHCTRIVRAPLSPLSRSPNAAARPMLIASEHVPFVVREKVA